jgi:glycosyltransferase involved in cell wall biosynthesis
LKQTYTKWRLIIRDDGSDDNTVDVLKYYLNKYPGKIILIDDLKGVNLGACQNYGQLLKYSDSDYIMFCDQDDVWLPDKIEITFSKMLEKEKTHEEKTPILIHTNLEVVDQDLNIISDSYWKYAKLNPNKGKTINRLLIQNVITGCTVMINKPLKILTYTIPKDAIIHDWWIALVAASFGRIDHINKRTILYRRHQDNKFGAIEWNNESSFRKMLNTDRKRNTKEIFFLIKKDLLLTQMQAKAFLECYARLLSEKVLKTVKIFSNLEWYNFLKKRYFVVKYGFFQIGIMRNIGLLIVI